MAITSILQPTGGVWNVAFAADVTITDLKRALDATFNVVADCRSVWDMRPANSFAFEAPEVDFIGQLLLAAGRETKRGRLAVVVPNDRLFATMTAIHESAKKQGSPLQMILFREHGPALVWCTEEAAAPSP